MKAATIASVLLTLAIAAPVVRHPSMRLFGHELVDRQHDPFTVMEQYAAGRVPPPYLQPVTDGAGIVLARVAGAVAGYNLLVLLTFVVTAAFAYAHARYFVPSSVAALVAALLFAFSPFHVAHAAYHVHIAQIQWIPLALLTVWRLADRPSAGRAAQTAAALLAALGASFYLGFVTAVVAPCAAIAYAPKRRAVWWTVAALAGSAAVAAACVLVAAPRVLIDRAAFGFPLFALDQHSARWWSYLVPPLGHPWITVAARIWRAAGIDQGRLEQQVSVGVSVLVLAAIGVGARTRVGGRFAQSAPALAITAIVALVCSLPPALTFGSVVVPMPSRLLYAVAPMFRSYARFGVVVSLMITTLAGGGVAVLLGRRTYAANAVAAVLVALAVFEYMPPRPTWRDVLPTSGHRWLANVDGARVLDCTTLTPGNTAGVAWLMKRDVLSSADPLADCAEPDLGAKLAAFGLTHVLIRGDSAAGSWALTGGTPDGTRMAALFRDAAVFETDAPRPRLYVGELAGFYSREYLARDSWRWMGKRGMLTAVNTTNAPVTASLELELDAFQNDRRVRTTIDQVSAAAIVATPTRQWHRMGPMTIAPGAHAIALEADTAVGAGDPRPLSVRLWRWRWVLESTH